MKDAAQRQADIFNNTTSSLGKGLSKSIKKKTSVASNFVRDLSEFCDTDDLIKSFRKLSNPQYHSNGYVIHTAKDWSKYRPSQNGEEEDYSDVSKDHVRSASDYYAQMRTSFARTHYKHNPQPSEEQLEHQQIQEDKIQI